MNALSPAGVVHLRPDHGMPGSVQHYWHFMFGYLLPAVDYFASHKDEKLLIESCGPVMDPVLDECLSALGADFRIVAKEEIDADHPGCRHVDLEHWDKYTTKPECREELRARVGRVIPVLKGRIPNRCRCGMTAKCRDRILLLDRSPMPDFYRRGGGSDSPSYGSARRHIRNLAETRRDMRALGYPVIVYEPGAHELGCQMEAFSNALGVIGIRGAEFVNLLWAPAGIPVFMLTPGGPRQPRGKYQQCLGACLEQNFVEGFCKPDMQVLKLDDFDAQFARLKSPWRRVAWHLYRLLRPGKV